MKDLKSKTKSETKAAKAATGLDMPLTRSSMQKGDEWREK
jgi:hypothetical protein